MNLRRMSVVVLALVLVSSAAAQVSRQTGIIRGVIVDETGTPLPGVNVMAAGPALQGRMTDISGSDGSYRLAALPPGTYEVLAELAGFRSVRHTGLIVSVGMTVSVNITLEPSAVQEEVTVTAASPTVDVQSTKISTTVSGTMIQRLPLNRNLVNIFSTVAGSSGTIETYSGSIHGGAPTTVSYEIDGVNANSPTHNGFYGRPQFDSMEEIEIVTGGLPAQVGNTGGSFVNIVTKSGGNEFHGNLQAFYTNENLAEVLFKDEQLRAMGMGKPSFARYDWDLSASLGGPIIQDKLWFYGIAGYKPSSRVSNFIPASLPSAPFSNSLTSYTQYDDPQMHLDGFVKFTTQIRRNFRFFLMFNGNLYDREVYFGGGARETYDATFQQDNNTQVTTTANLTWLLGGNTFIDFRLGLVDHQFPITSKPEFENNPNFRDGYTGYSWNGISSWQSFIWRHSRMASARASHFMDNVLGGNHEWGAGIEFGWGIDRYGYARKNPLSWHFYNGNPYYYRGYYNIDQAHPVFGDGMLWFTNCGTEDGDSWKDLLENRLGLYLQDSWTIRNRLTINLGIRMDYLNGWGGEAKTTGITGLPFEIGRQIFEPQIGFNPFGPFEIDPIKDVVSYTEISPRAGLTYDLFGNGRTALKLAYSRYAEAMPVMFFGSISPAVMARYTLNWFDLNANGQLDMPGIDNYTSTGGLGVFTRPDVDYLKSRIDPNLHPPSYQEVVASIQHELLKDFSVKVQYLYKRGKDAYGWALYDQDSGRYWYRLDEAPDWWVPFKTTVPAYGNYPAQEATVYFVSQNAPWNNQFTVQTNIPEAKREYHGGEIVIDKRYSNGWSLGGSMVLSQHKFFNTGGNPNQFTNGFGRAGEDIPFAVKIYGTFELPYGFVSSFFYQHTAGTPFGRSVTVAPPAAWAAANNVYPRNYSVNLENSGARRNPSYDNLDVRLEKEIRFAGGRFGLFLDAYNLLGNQYVYVGQNPGGTWRPTGANGTAGTFTPQYNYGRITGISGVRTFKFSLRYTF